MWLWRSLKLGWLAHWEAHPECAAWDWLAHGSGGGVLDPEGLVSGEQWQRTCKNGDPVYGPSLCVWQIRSAHKGWALSGPSPVSREWGPALGAQSVEDLTLWKRSPGHAWRLLWQGRLELRWVWKEEGYSKGRGLDVEGSFLVGKMRIIGVLVDKCSCEG